MEINIKFCEINVIFFFKSTPYQWGQIVSQFNLTLLLKCLFEISENEKRKKIEESFKDTYLISFLWKQDYFKLKNLSNYL